jgi:hypothetical protein
MSLDIPRGIDYESAFAAFEAAGNNDFQTPIANHQFEPAADTVYTANRGAEALPNPQSDEFRVFIISRDFDLVAAVKAALAR